MIQGKPKINMSVEDILSITSGGYDIYKYYIGKVDKIMQRPWGKKEKKLSWGVFQRAGIWYWKDQATEEGGNAIKFVQKMFSLGFKDAISKIIEDLALLPGTTKSSFKLQIAQQDLIQYAKIKFTSKKFEDSHKKFWDPAPEEFCNKYECYAVKDAAINGKRIPISDDEIVFAYYAPEEDAVKLYFPNREKENRFRNSVSYHYLWNFSKLQKCQDLIIQKSVKDMIFTCLIKPECTATQAEAIKIFNPEVVKKINDISENPWVWYGSDWDGVSKCKKITDTNLWKYINTPKNLLPEINDVYGYVKKFGINALADFIKQKRLI